MARNYGGKTFGHARGAWLDCGLEWKGHSDSGISCKGGLGKKDEKVPPSGLAHTSSCRNCRMAEAVQYLVNLELRPAKREIAPAQEQKKLEAWARFQFRLLENAPTGIALPAGACYPVTMRRTTAARHPQTNGICERFHKTILHEILRGCLSTKKYKILWMSCRATWMNGLNTITTKGHTKAKCVAEERPCKHFLMAKIWEEEKVGQLNLSD